MQHAHTTLHRKRGEGESENRERERDRRTREANEKLLVEVNQDTRQYHAIGRDRFPFPHPLF
ncbi:unnamed protein product, partial [Heterotrigona itama]